VYSKGPVIGIRHLQAALLLAICGNYIARLNVSVVVVAMTDSATTNPDFPEYNWSEAQRSYILSSFYFRGLYHHPVSSGILATAILSAVLPYTISEGGWVAFSVLRIIMGLFQGLIFPCIHEHLAKWSPPKDRNRRGVFAYSGADCGSVMAMGISGLIANSSMGWPGISYVSAGLCGIWCLLWLLLAANSAPSSKLVGQSERDYIERSLKREDGFHVQKIPIPWRALWTSVPFYAPPHCAQCPGLGQLHHAAADTRVYARRAGDGHQEQRLVLGTAVRGHVVHVLYISGICGDVAMSRKWMSLNTLRKSINTIAYWGPSAALIGIGFRARSRRHGPLR
ncbi:hypothetical protein ACLKA7_000122, partial [Drosophila subpalustris]